MLPPSPSNEPKTPHRDLHHLSDRSDGVRATPALDTGREPPSQVAESGKENSTKEMKKGGNGAILASLLVAGALAAGWGLNTVLGGLSGIGSPTTIPVVQVAPNLSTTITPVVVQDAQRGLEISVQPSAGLRNDLEGVDRSGKKSPGIFGIWYRERKVVLDSGWSDNQSKTGPRTVVGCEIVGYLRGGVTSGEIDFKFVKGDVIISYAGHEISGGEDLVVQHLLYKKGSELSVRVLRDNKLVELKGLLGDAMMGGQSVTIP